MSYPDTENDINNASSSTSASQFDVKKFIFKLVGFLPWIIISVLLSYSIATLYLRYTAQVHRVSAQLQIKDDEQSSPDYNIIRELGVMPGGKEIQDQIDILESYELARQVVDSLHLQFEVIALGRIATSPLYGKMSPITLYMAGVDTTNYVSASYKLMIYPEKFTLNTGSKTTVTYKFGDTFLLAGHPVYLLRNRDVKANSKGYNLVIKDTKSVATGIKSTIDVRKLHEMGGVLEIATNDEVPERAVDIINILIRCFNSEALKEKSIVSSKSNKFLRDRVDTVEQELNELEIEAGNFKRVNKITDITAVGAQYLTDVSSYDKASVEQSGQIKLLDGLYNFIQSARNSNEIIPSSMGINDQLLGTLILQYNNAVINYNAQTKISTEKDPIIGRLKNDINGYRESVLKNIQSLRLGYQTKLAQINQQYSDFSGLLAGLPEKERVLINLKRQISVKEQLYLFLLQKKEDAELSLAVVTGDSRIIDSAHDQGIILPKASQIKMFAFLTGILLPIIVMLLLDFFNNRITERREVEKGTKAPLLGELSYNNKQKNIIINPQSRSVLAEQFRLIRTNLQYLATDQKTKTILVTSFMSGEGKSFVSLNLAGSLVTGDKKVLLLELDLRKPKLSKYLNINGTQKGLTEYLVNSSVTIEDVITRLPGTNNIDIITSGPIPPNPTELLMSEKFNNLLASVKKQYDYVVIDSSPVGLVADAFLVGHAVDVTLFIIRHKYTYKTTINFIEKLHAEKKFNRLSVVINGIIASTGLGYGYGYGYGYSYGYGYHYGGGYYTQEQSQGLKGFINKVLKK